MNLGDDPSVTSDPPSRATGVEARDILPGIAHLSDPPRVMLLHRVTVEGVTRAPVMAATILEVTVGVEAKIVNFPLRGSHSSLVQHQVATLKEIEQVVTTEVLGLEVAVTVEQDPSFMDVSTP